MTPDTRRKRQFCPTCGKTHPGGYCPISKKLRGILKPATNALSTRRY